MDTEPIKWYRENPFPLIELPAVFCRDCLAWHHPDTRFYVTVLDAGRTGFLLGPYRTHAEAIAQVWRGHLLAENADPRAAFYGYGTTGVRPGGTQIKAVFGT